MNDILCYTGDLVQAEVNRQMEIDSGRSILTIILGENKREFFYCDNRGCHAGRSDIAYSGYHAGVLGWRRSQNDYIYCPDCVEKGLNEHD